MFLIRTKIASSPIHGMGCYADEEIKKGQLVWSLDPQMDLQFTPEQILSLPLATRHFLEIHCYAVGEGSQKKWILCGDHARHMNHSDEPNLLESGNQNEFNIAARDIKIGEELTCDYMKFDSEAEKDWKSCSHVNQFKSTDP